MGMLTHTNQLVVNGGALSSTPALLEKLGLYRENKLLLLNCWYKARYL